jgi:rubrerythrin
MPKEEKRMSKTEKNLWDAFAGESQANRKYLAFAEKADKEGFKQVAKLFRAAAHAETVHAHAHLRALKAVNDTAANLKEAISGETHEFTKMYPAMIEAAKEEGHKPAERTFTYANEVEKVHAALYQKALENMDKLPETDYHVCAVCGYTCEGEAPEKCPVCGATQKSFVKVD